MKKYLIFLIPAILTVFVLVLPDLYFERSDELYGAMVFEDELNIQVAENISVDKMIDVAIDENSRFIEYDAGIQGEEAERMEIGMEVLNDLEKILYMKLPDKADLIKNCYYNRVKVVGNSEYNSYVFSLCGMTFKMEDSEMLILYLPDTDEILSAYIFSFNELCGVFGGQAEAIEEMLSKYYGHDNWSAEIFESEVYFNQGSDRSTIEIIMDKMGLFEMEYPPEAEIYN